LKFGAVGLVLAPVSHSIIEFQLVQSLGSDERKIDSKPKPNPCYGSVQLTSETFIDEMWGIIGPTTVLHYFSISLNMN